MTLSFSLVSEPWIPCIDKSGAREELSLREALLRAHSLGEIRADSPPVTVALHRLLLALLHRAFNGPRGLADWRSLWEQRRFDPVALDEYLDSCRDSFDLFHPTRPFYQADYPAASEKSVISLVLEMASGNNPTLFDHHTEQDGVALTPAQAACALITSQAFGLGGLSGMEEKFTDAPCAKGVIFLVAGDNLFETLMLNLVRYTDEEPVPCNPSDDSPAWEMADPFKPERHRPRGYLDYLTWQNRRIRLIPEDIAGSIVIRRMTWGPGLRLDANQLDPMKCYRQDRKDGRQVLSFVADRAVWRDSVVLFRLGGQEHEPTKVVNWLSTLSDQEAIPITKQYRLMALGMAKGQAKIEFFRSETLPLPASYLKDENRCLRSHLSQALEAAENVGRLLRSGSADRRSAVFTMARLVLRPGVGEDQLARVPKSDEEKGRIVSLAKAWGVERYYWSGLGLHFHRLVTGLPEDAQGASNEWFAQLRRAASSAFERAEAYAGQHRAHRGVAKAREQFEQGLRRALPATDKHQSEGGSA